MTTPATSTGSLISSLPDLEASLAPLYDKPWSETVEKLDTLERAKIDILLSYAINDLIWGEYPYSIPSHSTIVVERSNDGSCTNTIL